MDNKFEPPVLFLIFNRPDTTQQVFNQIRQIKPKYLFVAADGPRLDSPGEIEKCLETYNPLNFKVYIYLLLLLIPVASVNLIFRKLGNA